MKRTYLLTLLLINYFGLVVAGNNNVINHLPNAINYQGIAYDEENKPLINKNITVRSSVLKGGQKGIIEWEEIHNVITQEDGYFEVPVGEGMRVGGYQKTFQDIQWNDTAFYLKIEIDFSGKSDFSENVIQRFCSVPFSFHAQVADSLTGINSSALKALMANTINSGGPVDLQQAYDNSVGGMARIEENQTTQNNGIWITANSPFPNSNVMLNVEAFGNYNGRAGYFRNNNTANNSITLFTRNFGLGNAFQAQVSNASNTSAAINAFHEGSGNSIQALNTGNVGTAPTIQCGNQGLGHSGFFYLRNAYSNSSSIRAEVEANYNSFTAQAGSFLISEAQNTVPVISSETKGLGNAGTFLINNIGNSSNALFTTTKGTGNAFAARNLGSSGSASYFRVYDVNNSSTAVYSENNGLGDNGYFLNDNITSAAASRSSVVGLNTGSGSAATFMISRNGNLSNVLTANTTGKGITAFLSNTNSINNSNVLEITQQGTGSLIRAYTNTFSAIYSNPLASFSVTNPLSSSPALQCEIAGNTVGVVSSTTNTSSTAGSFINTNPNNTVSSLVVGNSSNLSNGTSITSFATGGIALNACNTNANPAVQVLNNFNSGGTGLLVQSQSGTGITAYGGSVGINAVSFYNDAVHGFSNNGTGIYGGVSLSSPGYAGYFNGDVFIGGSYQAVLTKSAVIKNSAGEQKLVYSEESPEVWFTDYGSSHLEEGIAIIPIDPEFLESVNTEECYHVFIQLEDDCGSGVKVIDKTKNSFTVKTLNNAKCTATFSYRLSAKRKGFESLRLATKEENRKIGRDYLLKNWPELAKNRNEKMPELIKAPDLNSLIPSGVSRMIKPVNTPSIILPVAKTSNNDSEITPLKETEFNIQMPEK